MVDVPEQTVQTSDKLNTLVDAMVYYQVKDAKASEYNVDNHQMQLTSLARTTLRAVMGNMTLTECIQSRDKINSEVILTDKGITPQLLIGELPTSNKK